MTVRFLTPLLSFRWTAVAWGKMVLGLEAFYARFTSFDVTPLDTRQGPGNVKK